MGFFRRIFLNTNAEFTPSSEFPGNVEKAIQLVGNADFKLNNEQFVQLLTDNGIPNPQAIEILLFLPIAFVRHWLTNVAWPDTYLEGQKELTFSTTASYQVIMEVTRAYFAGMPIPDTIMKIGGRSAEFHAINQLLVDNPDTSLKDIELTPTVIIR